MWLQSRNILLKPPHLDQCRCSPIRTLCTCPRVRGRLWAGRQVWRIGSRWLGGPTSSAWCHSPGSCSRNSDASRWHPQAWAAPCPRASRCGCHPRPRSGKRGCRRGKEAKWSQSCQPWNSCRWVWIQECDTNFCQQWAAEMIHRSLMREPPQKW